MALSKVGSNQIDSAASLTVSGNVSADGGSIKLDGNYPTGTGNVAMGDGALDDGSLSGNFNTAIGDNALSANTSGASNTAIGNDAGISNTTGFQNVFVGDTAGDANTTGAAVVAVGYGALGANTTASNNTALGYQALTANETGAGNVAVGDLSLDASVNGSNNVAVGSQAGSTGTSLSNCVFVGRQAGLNCTGNSNTFLGRSAGENVTSGAKNTIVGQYNGNQHGLDIRTSNNNIVQSDGDGNIRYYINADGEHIIGNTSSSSDRFAALSSDCIHSIGSANRSGITSSMYARLVIQERSSNWISFVNGTPQHYGTIAVSGGGVSYGSNSDYRLKENIVDLTGATERLKQLEPKRFNFIDNPDVTTDGFLAHEVQAVVPEAVIGTHNGTVTSGNVEDAEGNVVHRNVRSDTELAEGETFVAVNTEPEYQQLDASKLVPLLVATIQELEARIAALEAG